jgi:hypothetical protein
MTWCDLHLFMISSAMDSGKRLNALTRYHLIHCAACREAQQRLNQLHGLMQEKGAQIRRDTTGEAAFLPFPGAAYGRAVQGRARGQTVSLWGRAWRPLAVTAAAILMVVLGVRLLREEPVLSTEPASAPVLEVRSRLQNLTSSFASTSLDDPMEQELAGLIESARGAADFLRSKVRKATGLEQKGAETTS